jgi:hypothetical protein
MAIFSDSMQKNKILITHNQENLMALKMEWGKTG